MNLISTLIKKIKPQIKRHKHLLNSCLGSQRERERERERAYKKFRATYSADCVVYVAKYQGSKGFLFKSFGLNATNKSNVFLSDAFEIN